MKNIITKLNESVMLSCEDTYQEWVNWIIDTNKGSKSDPDSKEAIADRLFDFITFMTDKQYIDLNYVEKLIKSHD